MNNENTCFAVLCHAIKIAYFVKNIVMKLIHTSLLAVACCFVINTAQAAKVKLKSGNLAALKGIKEMNVQYDYSNMTVTTKNKPEAEFIAEKKEDYNKKEAGKGDNWATSWVADREKRYKVQFKEEFDKQSGVTLKEGSDAKYTLIFHTTHTETGFNIGITRRNAYIDGEATIVETANPSNVIAVITVEDAQGGTFGGYDFDSGTRLQESYAVAGKYIGKFMKKKI